MAERAPRPRNALAQRLVSGAVLAPVVLAAVWFGGGAFSAFIALAGILMAWEWSRMAFGARNPALYTILIAGAALISALAGYLGPRPIYLVSLLVFWAAIVLLAGYHRAGRMGWAFAGLPYICLPVFALIILRSDTQSGLLCVLWLLIVVWTTDTAAFFTGRRIGGPKLAPGISPNKTWSGAIGGLIGATVAGYVFAVSAGLPGPFGLAAFSAGISIVGQIGDLIESGVKRRFQVKDTSNLIPGHGGVLDRLDSLLTTSVAALVAGTIRSGYTEPAQGALVWQW